AAHASSWRFVENVYRESESLDRLDIYVFFTNSICRPRQLKTFSLAAELRLDRLAATCHWPITSLRLTPVYCACRRKAVVAVVGRSAGLRNRLRAASGKRKIPGANHFSTGWTAFVASSRKNRST